MPAIAVDRSLGELAVQFGCTLHGNPELRIRGVASLAGGEAELGFVANTKLRSSLAASRLGAVVVPQGMVADCHMAALVHDNPHWVFAEIAAVLHPVAPLVPGTHVSACVHPSAQIHASAQIGPFVVIGAGVVIGPRCFVGAHSIVGDGVQIQADTRILERVTLCRDVRLGSRCLVHPGAVIGSDGFGNARDGARWVKVPQLGAVRVGDDVEIGANTTIDRGAIEDTILEDGVRLDNQIQIAHNVCIGAHTAIAACTGIAGSTRIGQRCMIGGGTGIGGQLILADDVVITGFGMVTNSIDKPGLYSSVMPVEEARSWRRIVGRIKRLDALVARVRRLEVAQQIPSAGTEKDDN
jgi:UDP-3-O-[3-hydroxymyristoyl] glucosamine N-acyltransferase